MKATSIILLCILCTVTSTRVINLKHVEHVVEFLTHYCGDIASFLPAICGVASVGPGCCGLFSVVDICRSTCRGTHPEEADDVILDDVKSVMYTSDVCAGLRVTGQIGCTAYGTWTVECDRLRCLMNMLCFSDYNFACYAALFESDNHDNNNHHDHNIIVGNNNDVINNDNNNNNIVNNNNNVDDSTTPKTQAVEGTTTLLAERNCFQLPELADAETSALLDNKSEFHQCPSHTGEINCDDPKVRRYRTIDGSCNNLQNPTWGQAFQPQKRLLPAQYEDGILLPRAKAKSGNNLPGPRSISRVVSPELNVFDDITSYVMAWGQFADHDFSGSPVEKNGTQPFMCCGDIDEALKVENGGPCFPIPIPPGDPLGRDCMQFVRSLPFAYPNGTFRVPREQINTLTSFVDASTVYGSTKDVLEKVKGENGLLKLTDENMLPENKNGTCKKELAGDYCMLAGDHRVNVFMGLGLLHTIFVRWHNKLVNTFRQLNPQWDDHVLFEEARRIVAAANQHVTYVEFLPEILNDETMTKYGLRTGTYTYDPDLDPTVNNIFNVAAFRFGHSQINQLFYLGSDVVTLHDSLMKPKFALNNMTHVIDTLASNRTESVDRAFSTGLTNHMFQTNSTSKDGLDLVSINIQRGRDHGSPPFNDWREFCNLSRINDFQSEELAYDLGLVYEDMDDVDIFVGLVAENHAPGSLVGPTLNCLLGIQFHALKSGDRFFYETTSSPERFTDDQLKELKRMSLAKILCDNHPDLKQIQLNVMRPADPDTNPITPCEEIPGIDLNVWKSG